MSDDLVNQLWESDEASALTNRAARRIEELKAREEAIVRGALEEVSDLADDAGTRFLTGGEEKIAIALSKFSQALRSLASDPAEVAAIIKKAGEDRG